MDKALEHTIENAISYARHKQRTNKLFKPLDESKEAQDFTNGDPETLYSIAALYAQDVITMDYDDALSEIEDALEKEFPDYI
jgi:hypothetical protein